MAKKNANDTTFWASTYSIVILIAARMDKLQLTGKNLSRVFNPAKQK
jgi:hypothetical protein